MKLEFTKMQGAGNDFVVIDATREPFALDRDRLRLLCDRHFGVGCDQVLVVEPARIPGTDFHYRIFNSDGGEVQQCGNGARCFVVFVRARGLTTRREIRVGTMCGEPLSHEEVLAAAAEAGPRLARVIRRFVGDLPASL